MSLCIRPEVGKSFSKLSTAMKLLNASLGVVSVFGVALADGGVFCFGGLSAVDRLAASTVESP